MDATDTKEAAGSDVLAVLLPSFKTPLLTGELLYAAAECGAYSNAQFVLLLDLRDPFLGTYKELVEGARSRGLSTGYFIFDGTPYCGKINRVAPLLRAENICVIDSRHMPVADGRPITGAISDWSKGSLQSMRVGLVSPDGSYPVVSRKLIERLGYLFHPLAYGRIEAEEWLLMLGKRLGILSEIEGAKVLQTPATGAEIIGASERSDSDWVGRTLIQTLDDEAERLAEFLVQ